MVYLVNEIIIKEIYELMLVILIRHYSDDNVILQP